MRKRNKLDPAALAALALAAVVLACSDRLAEPDTEAPPWGGADLQSGWDKEVVPALQENLADSPPTAAHDEVNSLALQEGEDIWDAMTEAEQQQALDDFERLVVPGIVQILSQQQARPTPNTPGVSTRGHASRSGYEPSNGEYRSGNLWVRPGSPPVVPSTNSSTADQDGDGLSDTFEDELAMGFSPIYFVSAGERDTIGFAEFYDQVIQRVKQTYGSTPVRLKYRVRPLAIRFDPGTSKQYGFLSIDCLTLWNADVGLEVRCPIPFPFLDRLLTAAGRALGKHKLDNEWSSILAAAPAVFSDASTYTYNTDPSTYRAYWIRTAAHEYSPVDRTLYSEYDPGGIPFGSHTLLFLSRHKHDTYPFPPFSVPLLNHYWWQVDALLFGLWNRFGWSWRWYCVFYFFLHMIFFNCIADSFIDQGGQLGQYLTNVGELSDPADGMRFIQDTTDGKTRLGYKLAKPIWSGSLNNLITWFD